MISWYAFQSLFFFPVLVKSVLSWRFHYCGVCQQSPMSHYRPGPTCTRTELHNRTEYHVHCSLLITNKSTMIVFLSWEEQYIEGEDNLWGNDTLTFPLFSNKKWNLTYLYWFGLWLCLWKTYKRERNWRERKGQNEEWLMQRDRIIIPFHMKQYLYQSRQPWARRPADLPWHCQMAEREQTDFPWLHSEPKMRAVCQAFDCGDWLIMLQGSMIRHLGWWHAGINEHLLGASLCVWLAMCVR